MSEREPGQVAYEAWIGNYFTAPGACDRWEDLTDGQRSAWAAAEQASRAVPEPTEQAPQGGWVAVTPETMLQDGAPVWLVWSGHVQQQPWRFIEATEDDEAHWYFDGHDMPLDQASHYMPLLLPPPPVVKP